MSSQQQEKIHKPEMPKGIAKLRQCGITESVNQSVKCFVKSQQYGKTLASRRAWTYDDFKFKVMQSRMNEDYTLSCRCLLKCLNNEGIAQLVLSPITATALDFADRILEWYRDLTQPSDKRKVNLVSVIDNGTGKTISFDNGSKIICTANIESLKGYGGDLLVLEFAWNRHAKGIYTIMCALLTWGKQVEVASRQKTTGPDCEAMKLFDKLLYGSNLERHIWIMP